ncbi:sodium/proline symporter PutP [Lachnospiraceae bacterium ZAX-1]
MSSRIWIIIAFVIYTLIMLAIGAKFFEKKSNMSNYFLGGRGLNHWVAAISAQASDMSGWLLMGLPGAVYAFGTGQLWIAVGLAVGTALNWIIVAKRFRRYTILAGDSITIPQFFENRYRDKTHIIKIASGVFIAIFFAVYTASGFVSGATLFSQVFGIDYTVALVISVAIILVYTFLGGFSAVSWTDLIQGLLMLAAIFTVPILAVVASGGISNVTANIPPQMFNAMTDSSGQPITLVSIISQLGWGLGYFGMPHILVRFMAIKSDRSVKKSATIAIVWVAISLTFAVLVGIIGIAFLPDLAANESETVFIKMIQKVFLDTGAIAPVPIIGGLFLCGILAAIMSTADSQLLVTASALTSDIYRTFDKKASDNKLVWISRGAVILVALVAFFIATDNNSSIMGLVSNAWSGFGSAFGALVLFSLFWKRTNGAGAAAGILSGGITVIIWDYVPLFSAEAGKTLADVTGLYSLVVGFAISAIFIVCVSLLTKTPKEEITLEFEKVSTMKLD